MKYIAGRLGIVILFISFGFLAAVPAGASTIKLLGGLSFGNLRYSQSDLAGPGVGDANKYRQGICAGIGFESQGKVGWELDVLYLQKGMKNEGSWNLGSQSVDSKIDTVIDEISVPLTLRFNLMENTGVYFLGGVEAAYILSAKSKYSYTGSGGEKGEGVVDLMENDAMNRFDFGVLGGAGFGYNRQGSGFGFYIEGRYHYGLANLVNTTASTENEYLKTNAVVVLVGLIF